MPYSITIPNGCPINPALFPLHSGVKVKGNSVTFSDAFTPEAIETITRSAWDKDPINGTGKYIVKKLKAESANILKRADIEALGVQIPEVFTDEEFNFFIMSQANTLLDRQGDKLTRKFLQRLADNTNSQKETVPILFNHNKDMMIGNLFHEDVKRMNNSGDESYELVGYMAVNKKVTMPGQPNLSIADAIKSKMLTNVSIGFVGIGKIKEAGSKVYQEFDYDENDSFMPEHFETSLVYFPAQYGATVKSYAGKEHTFNFKDFSFSKITKKQFQISMDITVNGKSIPVTPEIQESDGKTTATIKGLDAVQSEIKSLEAKASKYEALEKAFKELNQETINDIQNMEGEKGLKKSFTHSEAELASMAMYEPVKFKALHADLKKEFTAGTKTGQLGNPGKPETEFNPLSRFK
jgi:hypothetical protein